MRYFISKYGGLVISDLLKGTSIFSEYRSFKKMMTWSREDILSYQMPRLKKLLSHAYDRVPFYTKRFNKYGIRPEKIHTLDDFSKIPPLTRMDIQKNLNDLSPRGINLKKCYRGSSSGSTGEPVVYYHDAGSRSAGWAVLYLAWELCDWKFGDKGLHIWGNPQAINVQWKKCGSRFKALLTNIDRYPAYRLTDPVRFIELIEIVKSRKYDYIDGYTNAIFLLAQMMQDKSHNFKKLKCVLTTGETLHDFQRQTIKDVLGPVYDQYGCGEIMGVAFQSKESQGYYHVFEPHVVMEFDPSFAADDGSHPILLTDLDNWAMPMIRYQNGDMAVPAENSNPSCDLPLRTLRRVSGRTSDIIELPGGGNLVVPSFFGSKLLRLVKGIRQYQVEQPKTDQLIIRLVADQDIKKEEIDLIEKALHEYLSDRIGWRIEFVDKIDPEVTGKHKLVIDRTKNH